jgi:hypothetical protein
MDSEEIAEAEKKIFMNVLEEKLNQIPKERHHEFAAKIAQYIEHLKQFDLFYKQYGDFEEDDPDFDTKMDLRDNICKEAREILSTRIN